MVNVNVNFKDKYSTNRNRKHSKIILPVRCTALKRANPDDNHGQQPLLPKQPRGRPPGRPRNGVVVVNPTISTLAMQPRDSVDSALSSDSCISLDSFIPRPKDFDGTNNPFRAFIGTTSGSASGSESGYGGPHSGSFGLFPPRYVQQSALYNLPFLSCTFPKLRFPVSLQETRSEVLLEAALVKLWLRFPTLYFGF